MTGIHQYGPIEQALFFVFSLAIFQIPSAIVGKVHPIAVLAAPEDPVCQGIAVGGDLMSPEDKALGLLRGIDGARSPLVGFFIPTGMSIPLAVSRCC